MFNEAKIFFENIKNFRHLLTEGVSDKTFVNAINNHEYLYIYYAGDDTIEKGYRTVRPFVLGLTTAGNLAVRAWQDKGKSDSLRADAPRRRQNHEIHTDTDGKSKAGWRLFLIDNITSAYPTGKKFEDNNGNVMIPPLYNQNDKQMSSIVASISANPEKEIQASGETSAFKTQTSKLQSFYNANINNRKINKIDVENLVNIAKRVMKKPINNFFVAIDDKNNFVLKDVKTKNTFPRNAIVGDLTSLYNQHVLKNQQNMQPKNDGFFKQGKEKVKNNLKQNDLQNQGDNTMMKEDEKIPFIRKTFFK